METRQVQNIIRSFFGKRFSKETQLCFRYWFRSSDARNEKEVAMREIWEQMPALITERTWEALSDMQERITREPVQTGSPSAFLPLGKICGGCSPGSRYVCRHTVGQPSFRAGGISRTGRVLCPLWRLPPSDACRWFEALG